MVMSSNLTCNLENKSKILTYNPYYCYEFTKIRSSPAQFPDKRNSTPDDRKKPQSRPNLFLSLRNRLAIYGLRSDV